MLQVGADQNHKNVINLSVLRMTIICFLAGICSIKIIISRKERTHVHDSVGALYKEKLKLYQGFPVLYILHSVSTLHYQ